MAALPNPTAASPPSLVWEVGMMMVVWMPDDDASQGQADVWCFAVSGQWQSFFGFSVILKKQVHGVLLCLASGNHVLDFLSF